MKLLLPTLSLFSLTLTASAIETKKADPAEFLALLQSKLSTPTSERPKDYKEFFKVKDGKEKYFCAYDELQFLSLESTLLKNLKVALKSKDSSKIADLLSRDGAFQPISHTLKEERNNFKIKEYIWNSSNKSNKSAFLKNISSQFESISNVRDVRVIVKNVAIPPTARIGKSFNYNYANLSGHFEYSYSTNKSERRIDRADFVIAVEKKNNKDWKISSIEFENGKSLISSSAPKFVEVTAELGLNKVPNYLRKEAIRRGGYTLAISDYNNDKKPDLFVGTSKKGLFYKFENGKYVYDQKNSRLAPTLSKAAAFADFSNSNSQDLIIAKFNPIANSENVKSEVIMLKNDGKGNFSLKERVINDKSLVDHPMPIAVADFNKNNFLDLYVGYPGAKDFTLIDNREASNNKKRQDVYLNDKSGKFSSASGFFSDTSEYQKLYPHSALAIDYDLDSDMDLLVIDDRANLSPTYENKDGALKLSNKKIGLGVNDYGMAIAAADKNLDGKLDLALSSVNFHAAERVRNSCITNWDIHLNKSGTSGVRMFKSHKSGKYTENTSIAGLENPGEGVGGVLFFDYNNDGLEDIYVTNGLWSAEDEYQEQSLSSLFYLMSNIDSNSFNMSQLGQFEEKTHSHIMNVLLNYSGNIRTPLKKGASMRASLAGHQRNKLYRNNGDETFTEVAFLEGVDSLADGYMATTFDYNQDGNMDLILRNADPGVSTKQFKPIQVFNNVTSDKKSVVLHLKSRSSNRDAVGSILRAKIGSKTHTRHLTAVQGTIQAEKLIHFGLGSEDKINSLTITWPSGRNTKLTDLKAGRYEIEEEISGIVFNK
ncbi:CRTAC1 family protein [Halobacteriovorax marinus]|uniref:CRTAC1 family protein n=1 Tax=Halobacteriovorax marinus TaxID=97084 RepID=UPI003A8CB49C